MIVLVFLWRRVVWNGRLMSSLTMLGLLFSSVLCTYKRLTGLLPFNCTLWLDHTALQGTAELRSCVKVEVAVLSWPSLIVRTVSVDVSDTEQWTRDTENTVTVVWRFQSTQSRWVNLSCCGEKTARRVHMVIYLYTWSATYCNEQSCNWYTFIMILVRWRVYTHALFNWLFHIYAKSVWTRTQWHARIAHHWHTLTHTGAHTYSK